MKSQKNCEDEFALFQTYSLKFCLILSFDRRNALLCEIKKTLCFLVGSQKAGLSKIPQGEWKGGKRSSSM